MSSAVPSKESGTSSTNSPAISEGIGAEDLPSLSTDESLGTGTCTGDDLQDLTQFLEGMFPELKDEANFPVLSDVETLVGVGACTGYIPPIIWNLLTRFTLLAIIYMPALL